jgi:hypothetical protein
MRVSPSASASAPVSRGHVDRADARVRVRRTHHRRIGLSGKIEVIAIATAPGDETQIFFTANRISDACTHGRLLAGWSGGVNDNLMAPRRPPAIRA